MTVKYLLPCSCGEKIAIETSQAGQTIRCSCGEELEVPTMQGIRRLEQAAETTSDLGTPPAYGGVALGIALLGLMVLLAGGGLTAWTYSRRPIMVDINYMSPWETWLMWNGLKEGVRLPEYAKSPYLERKKETTQYMTFGIAIMVIGSIMLACSAAIGFYSLRSQRRQLPQRAP